MSLSIQAARRAREAVKVGVRGSAQAADSAQPAGPASGFDHDFRPKHESLLTGLRHVATFARSPSRVGTGPAVLPPHSSLLFRAIFEACQGTVRKGTVAEDFFATDRNVASPDVYLTGKQIFPRIAERIAQAKREITYQALNWQAGSDAAHEILHGLKELEARRRAEGARGPVVVRMVINESTLKGLRSYRQMVTQLQALGLDPRLVKVEAACHFSLLIGLLHSKSLVVDGEHAILTGANPESCHDANRLFYDAAYELEGQVALGLRGDFEDLWWRCTGRSLPPRVEPRAAIDRPGVPMLITTRKPDGLLVAHRTDNTASQAFLALARNSQERIRLHTPNLNAGPLTDELMAAAERGCEVEVVLSRGFNDHHENLPFQGGTNDAVVARMYAALEARGVPGAADRLKVRWYSADGKSEVMGDADRASHAKFMSGDSQVAVVGSSNGDTQSWNHSRETNVVIDDGETTAEWERQFFEPSFARSIPARPERRQG